MAMRQFETQKGVVLVTVLLVIALVVTLAATLASKQLQFIQFYEFDRAQSQTMHTLADLEQWFMVFNINKF